eukprot:TRINITY_DN7302_c0_g2_i8.p1 TRINITY_DN7302_c0_g2~~TRINITY_DN7302_c0_g2_i8.p1  ORF type:complete len:499 (-),score=49.30 TRINITY_DN7302_c0_g2_i8:247-1743(-)
MDIPTLTPYVQYEVVDISEPLNCTTLREIDHDPRDWLFHTRTIKCGCGEWDNLPSSTLSRIFLPLFYLAVACVIVALGALRSQLPMLKQKTDAEEEVEEASPGALHNPQQKNQRLWYIDYVRILCIAATVTEHSGGTNYSGSNVLWTQQWVLPYLYTVSGICFMFSSAPLLLYEAKLAVVLLVGVCFNFTADVISGRDWLNNPGNTIFQMAYVILLMGMSVMTNPLREALIWRSEHPFAKAPLKIVLYTSVAGLVFAFAVTYFTAGIPFIDLDNAPGMVQGLRGSGAQGILTNGPLMLSMIAGLNFLSMLACTVGVHDSLPVVLLAAIYVPRFVIPYNRGGHPINADLFMFGMVIRHFPLHHQAKVKSFIREYWVIWVAALLICSDPDVIGRCDLWPLNSTWERLRFYAIECWMVILLISGALNTGDSLGLTFSLNLWALYAYCSHVAWARVLPVPYGAIVTYAAAPVFVLFAKHQERLAEDGTSTSSESSEEALTAA